MQQIDFAIEGLLLDMDGTLYIDGEWIPGVVELLSELLKKEFPLLFVTNTTTKPRKDLLELFMKEGLQVREEQIITPLIVARSALEEVGVTGVTLLMRDVAKTEFSGLKWQSQGNHVVLVGEMGEEFTMSAFNHALRQLMEGASLWAFHTNRFYKAKDGLCAGPGGFVRALEYAASVSCERVLGKPQRDFYMLAAKILGKKPENLMMIGDDFESDVLGSLDLGFRSCLVKSGKASLEQIQEAILRDIPVLEDLTDLKLEPRISL